MKLKLNNVRLAFPVLFEAEQFQGQGEFAYSASFLVEPDDPQVATINKAIDAVALEKWGKGAAAILKAMRAKDASCLHDGDLKAKYDGFEGMLYVSARNAGKKNSAPMRPTIIDRDKSPLTAKDGKPYAGCYVHVSLELWAQDNGYGQKVNASIRGVQFFADGDAFSGSAPASEDEFDDLSEGATADDLA